MAFPVHPEVASIMVPLGNNQLFSIASRIIDITGQYFALSLGCSYSSFAQIFIGKFEFSVIFASEVFLHHVYIVH